MARKCTREGLGDDEHGAILSIRLRRFDGASANVLALILGTNIDDLDACNGNNLQVSPVVTSSRVLSWAKTRRLTDTESCDTEEFNSLGRRSFDRGLPSVLLSSWEQNHGDFHES